MRKLISLSALKLVAAKRRRSRGFTLIEATISLLLMSLLLLGSIDLFITALRNSTDSNALVFANLDASNALQSIVESTREAYYFQLPDESDFTAPAGTTSGSYQTTMTVGSQVQTICSGMLVRFPNATQSASVDFSDGSSHTVTGLYSRDQGVNALTPGVSIMYYRADLPSGPGPYSSAATPDASNGNCLWAYSCSDNGATIDRPIIKSVAPDIPNAVQFVRPQTVPNALGVTSSIPYEVEIKIICSYYAATGGGATNEVSNAEGTTSLDGKCVFMRDHELSSSNESGSLSTLNNHFMP